MVETLEGVIEDGHDQQQQGNAKSQRQNDFAANRKNLADAHFHKSYHPASFVLNRQIREIGDGADLKKSLAQFDQAARRNDSLETTERAQTLGFRLQRL